VRGVLAGASQESFQVQPDDAEERSIRYEDVTSARTVFRWERAPKPGGKL
jgi:hypothetical protein